ncbi:MAG TPA: hypothetical protein VMZ53_19910 [Kofleriaceae bacterium]|nr:hypothetical protein [Kofleriaceae bacterium]
MTWLRVWRRAVIAPAYRRAGAVWVGSAIVGALVFGANGMHPHDLTGLALHRAGVAAVLGTAWLLLFLPTARLLVRPDGAAYLRSLPHAPAAPRALAAAALVGLQLPWLLLWLVGERALGLAIVCAGTLVIAALASWSPRARTYRTPTWSTATVALAAVYIRALTRRASDALVRGIGLAILAGLFGGLMIRNNAATGAHAAVFATASLSLVLVPGWAGALMPLVEARRQAAWLAHSLGISRSSRLAALYAVVAAIYVATMTIALGATTLIATTSPPPHANAESPVMRLDVTPTPPATTFALLALIAFACGLGAACIATRGILHADVAASDDPRDTPRRGPAAARVVVGAAAGAGLIVLALALLGAIGALGVLVLGIAALATAKDA